MPPRHYTRASPNLGTIDFTDPAYGGRVVLYVLFGVLDAMWQTTSYWLMGAMSNDPAKLAFLTGFCKGCCTVYSLFLLTACFQTNLYSPPERQLSGEWMLWKTRKSTFCHKPFRTGLDGFPRFMNIFISTWTLLAVGLLLALPMIHIRVKDHTELVEETMYAHAYSSSSMSILTIFRQVAHGWFWKHSRRWYSCRGD